NEGSIFKIMPDGTGYSDLFDFSATGYGSGPDGSLYYDGTYLYGTTEYGGVNNDGVVFKIKTDGTGYSKLLDFAGTTNGNYPFGALISDGTYLYGMTNAGGSGNLGTLYKIKKDGTAYAKLVDFNGTTSGANPLGALYFDGTYLYGMTELGGALNIGTVFKLLPDGSGYTDLFDFNGGNGREPMGGLISDGTYLYGMTNIGGVNDDGVVFKIRKDGTGYVHLADFNNAGNGANPHGDLYFDGSTFYGTTSVGGANSMGTVFKFTSSSTGIEELQDHPESLSVYPNPATNQIQVQLKSEQDWKSLQITTMLGQEVMTGVFQQGKASMDISHLPNGTYLIKAGPFVRKIIKQ
ncbi:MAG TPA: choice-of-anchor tandem repeat GloVer-containing protein, partial [Bacteroidia bacterium]|nr:choice-of-anchor tandem repeat GloVer-containing protein [Bacteroidia bacterium]